MLFVCLLRSPIRWEKVVFWFAEHRDSREHNECLYIDAEDKKWNKSS